MNQRTSKPVIAGRSFIGVLGISIVIGLIWNVMTGTLFWTLGPLVIGSLMIVVFFGGFGWLVVNLGTRLFCGRDPEFQNYLKSGGDPYFDTLPPPLNPDSQTTRETGMAEPTTSFKPPRSWTFQCPLCGAKQPSRICVCWNCNYGDDGDSTAYFDRWGDRRPSDIAPEQWTQLTGKRDDAS